MKDWLEWTRQTAKQVVEQFVPAEANLFDDVWPKLRREVEQWRGQAPTDKGIRRYRKRAASVLGPGIRMRGQDLVTPWVIGVLVASVFELAARRGAEGKDVKETVQEFVRRFRIREVVGGETEKVEQALTELLMLDLNQLRAVQVTVPRSKAARYIILTHEEVRVGVTAKQLSDFRSRHSEKDFFVWIDETKGDVCVDGGEVPLGYRLRKVLQCLVKHEGEAVSHGHLVATCGQEINPETGAQYTLADDQVTERWVRELRRAGQGQLGAHITTTPKGFAYGGPRSFCIIKYYEEDRSA